LCVRKFVLCFQKEEISVGRNHKYQRTVIIWRVSQNTNIQFNSLLVY